MKSSNNEIFKRCNLQTLKPSPDDTFCNPTRLKPLPISVHVHLKAIFERADELTVTGCSHIPDLCPISAFLSQRMCIEQQPDQGLTNSYSQAAVMFRIAAHLPPLPLTAHLHAAGYVYELYTHLLLLQRIVSQKLWTPTPHARRCSLPA